MTNQLFAYGTLMRGGLHEDLLAARRDVRFLGPARCRGSLYDLGTHPAMVPEGRTWVAGELFRAVSIEEVLRLLDAMEGEAGFERRLLPVRWKRGEAPAWVYVFVGALDGAPLIAGGSYKAWLRRGPPAKGAG